MIINSSDITLAATHSKIHTYEKTETSVKRVRQQGNQESAVRSEDKLSISEKAFRHLEKDLSKALKHLEKNIDKYSENPEKGHRKTMRRLAKDLDKAIMHLQKHMSKAEASETEEMNDIETNQRRGRTLGLINNILKELTGRDMNIKDLKHRMDKIEDHEEDHDDDGHDEHRKAHTHGHRGNQTAWDIQYTMHESVYERQDMNFNAGGVVRTADGREVNFSLDLMMSREYMSQKDINITASGIGSDPVILDFPGPASELANAEFDFGIEVEDDEDKESLSYLSLGSGLLSLDANSDGVITDIHELVGTTTGDGFAELAAHDEDGNNWIDENDSIFSQLRLWNQDTEGNGVLSGLLEQDVGAIYLGNVDTPFELKDSQNTLLGEIEKSGIYLNEDGTPGTIQQISMIV